MGRASNSPPLAKYPLGIYNLRSCWYRGDDEDREVGLGYYTNFRARLLRLGSLAGCSQPTTTLGVFAALSPNNTEKNNTEDMVAAVRAHKADIWHKLTVRTYGPNKEKAKRILDGEDPDLVLKGVKTNSFYHNLLDPEDDRWVTVDGHMVNIWNGARVPLDLAGVSMEGYRMVERGVREAADRFSVPASGFQATVWGVWRRINGIQYQAQRKLAFEDRGLNL